MKRLKAFNVFMLVFFLGVWLSWNLSTLDKNPLPWLDETYFSAVSKKWLDQGEFVPSVTATMTGSSPVFHYGPTYFVLTALSYHYFGFGIFQFRIVNFVSGIVLVFLVFLFLSRWLKEWEIPAVISLALLIDPFYQLSLHEGRMDLLACALVVVSFYFLLESKKPQAILWSAIFLGFGLITSFRTVFYFPGFLLALALQRVSCRKVLIWALVVGIPMVCWLFYCFDSGESLLIYVRGQNDVNSIGYFFNTSWPLYVPVHSHLLMVVCLGLVIITVYHFPEAMLEKTVVIFGIVIFSFYVLVIDYGPYSVLILPFYYILGAYFSHQLPTVYKYVPIALLLIFNIGYSGLKAVQVYNSLEIRNHEKIDAFVRTSVPAKSKVVGDVVLYYSVMKFGIEFQYIDHPGNDIKIRESRLLKDYDFDYLILSDQYVQRSPNDAAFLIHSGRYAMWKRFEKSLSPPRIDLPFLDKLSQMENNTGYNCTLYKRIR